MELKDLKAFLDYKANAYEKIQFLEQDPISIPHKFNKKEDIEISAFLVATISWGNRISIIKSGERMIQLLGDDPYNFIMSHSDKELNQLSSFVHRTFNGTDFIFFIKALKHIYKNHGGLEYAFSNKPEAKRMNENISYFKKIFFELPHNKRTQKHVSDPFKGSAAKRLNMYLRWMVRSSKSNVDFGIWKRLSPSQLSCPLDVHSGKIARYLGLLKRKQNDQNAVLELDIKLRDFDPIDPVKYDFALFGLGVYEKFNLTHLK
tara:strand:+ start:3912 stop:4694 length:783 start_codon:yes stop_codon:yes gene_type:complete